jgi:hypothetical protein
MAEPMQRITAPARASLRPQTLARVSRLTVLDRVLRERAQAPQRQLVMITGEGGVGKSVLLGQLLERADERREAGAALLIACGDVHLTTACPTRHELDDAFGAAAGGPALLAMLGQLATDFGSVTLLVDTLDLLVGPETVRPIAALLAAALSIGDVVVTCRYDEYRAYFHDAALATPQLTDRLLPARLPPLTPAEVVRWAELYFEQQTPSNSGDDAEAAAFMEALGVGLWRDGAIRDVCTVPLRLRLTCEVFADRGHLPEELTVTGLYNEYWATRVALHSGRRSADGDAKEQAALAVAALLLADDGRLALTAAKRRLDATLLAGLRMLVSEGVLIETTAGWQFFHQSFAEYAVARWMLAEGVDSAPIVRLAERLQAGQNRLWTIAGSVLTQVDPNDPDTYARLAAQLPPDGLVGAQAHTVAALHQRDPMVLADLVQLVRSRPVLWPAVLPDLGKAPRDVGGVPTIIAGALAQAPGTLAGPAAAAFISLAGRARPAGAADVVVTALEVFAREREKIDQKIVDQHVARVLRTQQRATPTDLLDRLLDRLPALLAAFGPLFAQAAVRVLLANADRLDERQQLAFGRAILDVTAPPLEDAESIALVHLLWRCAALRAERGWHTWRALITDTLPTGPWHNAVVRYAATLAADDIDIRAAVVDDLLEGRGAGTAHVNVFEHVAAADATWIAERLLATTVPTDRLAVGAICSATQAFARDLPPTTATALADWLTPARDGQPRVVWPAQITLLGASVPHQRELFDELTRSNPPTQVLSTAVDAWLFRTTSHVLDELTPQLRTILQSPDPDVQQTRARLEGRRAGYDAEARTWIDRQLLHGLSPRIASTAVKTIADVLRVASAPMDPAIATWMAGLLETRHLDACRGMLALLGDDQRTDPDTYEGLAAELVPVLSRRFEEAVRTEADAQLSQALLDCLIRADRTEPVPADVVRSIFNALQKTVVSGGNRSTTVRILTNFCGTLMAGRFTHDEVHERIGALLTTFDPGTVAKKTVRSVASLLGGVARRDPSGPSWLEELFWRPETPPGSRLAIAEALLSLDNHRASSRAVELTQRPDCPPDVIAFVLPRLRG